MTVPLKLKDSAAPTELQVFSSTEENYLAYQAGLHLASQDSSDVGSLALSTHGTLNLVGNIVDTSYDSAVGTGGDQATLTFTTVTTPLKQTRGTITPSGANNRLPVMQRDSDGQRVIREMNDSDMDSLLTRVGSRIFTSDYPGSYKIATSTPAGGYTAVKTGLANDTRTDGASTTFNLYRRTTMTAPTKVLPFSIKRSGGDTGTYQGLQLMTDDQVKYSIGTRLQNKISNDTTDIGNYRIYSSAAGTPSNNGLSGTWTSKGTVTDTRQAIVDANYTRTRISTYSSLRTSNYTGDYTRTRTSTYASTSMVSFSRDYSTTHSKTRTSLYTVSGFIGNFIGNYSNTDITPSTRESANTVDYTRSNITYTTVNFFRNVEYVGTYTRSSAGLRGGTFTGDYSRSSVNVHAFSRFFTGNFAGEYARVNTYTGNYSGDYLGNFVRERLTAASEGVNYARDFTGDYSRQFLGERDSNYASENVADYQGTNTVYTAIDRTAESNAYSRANFGRGFVGDYTGNYSRNFTGDFLGNYTGNFVGNYLRAYLGNYQRTFVGDYGQYSDGYGNVYSYQRNRLQTYLGNYLREGSTASFSRPVEKIRVTGYARDYLNYVRGVRTSNYTGDFTGNYLGNFVGNYTGNYVGDFTGDFTGDYQRTFVGNYTRDYVGTRSSNYLGEDAFSRDFLGNFAGDYSRQFNTNYLGEYTRNFAGNYTGDYTRNFLGNYTRGFVGNYAGDTIGSGNTNIETYTLYVRTA